MSQGKYPAPAECIYCNAEVKLVSNAEIYGKKYGNGMCYKCSQCDAYVGVHPDLVTPLGVLADRELRNLKKKAHSLFDPIWQNKKHKGKARNSAYRNLADKLKIEQKDCHFGHFGKNMLLEAISVLEKK